MIHDLAIIMLTAGITSLLCKFLKQPVVLGYIVAGLLVGPHVAGDAWVSNEESVEMWGQVGVIFLLFCLGLEFSFKKLVAMGSTAIISCLVIVIGMMSTGFMVGRLMGWNEMNALFLGGMLCMSSTTIVFKALDELGLRQQKFAGICFGILVVEDLFAVVLMVILASIAVKQSLDGQEMLMSVTKLAAYLLFWFVAGIMLIPTLLRVCKRHLNDETMTIVSLGLCLGMVLLATSAGFSEALGAFVMGSILAETLEVERIEHLMSPIKNMFGAVFFVSVGMMINPDLLLEYWLPITIITLIVIVGQITFTTIGVVLSGESLRVAMQAGFSLVQVGEFAFIIAQFGESIGVTEKYLYPVVVAVSVITTFLTPYIIRLSVPAYLRLYRHLPHSFTLWLDEYSRSRGTQGKKSEWRTLLQHVGLTVAIYVVCCIFLLTLYLQWLSPVIVEGVNHFLPDNYEWVGRLTSLLLIFSVLSPMLYKMVGKHVKSAEFQYLIAQGSYHRGLIILMQIVRILLALGFVNFTISQFFSFTTGMMVVILFVAAAIIFYSRNIHNQSARLEQQFLSNLQARENAHEAKRVVGKGLEAAAASYDLHLAEFEVPSSSTLCGQTLLELNLRQRTGINVISIVREHQRIDIPGPKHCLFPHDKIVVAGLDAQISAFKSLLDKSSVVASSANPLHSSLAIIPFIVDTRMPFCGKPLKESRIAQLSRATVLCIEHDNIPSVNPSPDQLLLPSDMVVLAGDTSNIQQFLKQYE